ncbi:MAG: tRNA adenosine(34) deaminase TadA [Paludisphaera borealis]|uniref:tRNA adenosine(34) deaminase TadA n=1 Tax=Paludisphaera borealis TaxID=1387353 RepID=UPI00284D398A|nr:tRNA adenosine(34) deaminase TadA [Paludisphaera borealis]MDR3622351.1 tRNA adenosine(34) deaminase TadA [Paludisphaera borealis]
MSDEVPETAGDAFDHRMMEHALDLARQAAAMGEVPVGALIVREGRIVSQAFNLRETLHDPTAHAERLALTLAGRALGSWRLEGCTLYVTLEPCVMCAGAIVQSRVQRLVYGAVDRKAGACQSLYRLVDDRRMNHRVELASGILAEECGEILSLFFHDRRGFPKLR